MISMYKFLEETRVFSQLTGGCYYADVGREKYVCIGGIVLPYRIGVNMMIWVMAKSTSYHHLLDVADIQQIITMNPESFRRPNYGNKPQDRAFTCWDIFYKIETIMRNWSMEEFDKFVPCTE